MGTNPSGIFPGNIKFFFFLPGIKVLKQAEHLMASRITLLNPQLTAPPLHGKKKKLNFDFSFFSCCSHTLPTKFSVWETFGQKNLDGNGLFVKSFLFFSTQGMKFSVQAPLCCSGCWGRWMLSSKGTRWQLGWDRAKGCRKVNFLFFLLKKNCQNWVELEDFCFILEGAAQTPHLFSVAVRAPK